MRYAVHGLSLLACASACGSGVVDVGDLPENGGGLGGSPSTDAGTALDPAAATCAALGVNRYRLVFDSDGGKLERRIYSMRADGSELEALTPVGELAREPALSPDGSLLAYTTPEGVKLLDSSTGQAELVFPQGDQPFWSADGSRLLGRNLASNTIAILQVSDRTYPDEFEHFYREGLASPLLTPDGAALVYATAVQGFFGIYALDVPTYQTPDEVTKSPVPSSPVLVTHPTVSPDGVWVAAAVECGNGKQSSLWTSPLAVSTPACEGRRITRGDSAAATNPKWGPGVLIAYERGEPPRDIAIVAADTGDECAIPQLGDDRNPSWAGDAFRSPE